MDSTQHGIAPYQSSLPGMSDVEFVRWTRLLEQRTGMTLPIERKSFLVSNLNLRMREIACANYQAYYDFLNSGTNGFIEWAHLVDRLTVHETRFFRHSSSLQLIEEEFLPQLSARKMVSINAWSAGCATGEEAYTLAMVIDNYFASRGEKCYLAVTGTDISRATLTAARHGVYHRRKLVNVPPIMLQRYCTPTDDFHYRISSQLSKRVCFIHMNFMEMQNATLGKMDIIFCQNVLIYFNQERRLEILGRLVEKLNPGGLLVLGPGEILHWKHPKMERAYYKDTLAYRCLPEPAEDMVSEKAVWSSARGYMQ